ncbi:AMP-binding protein [Streptomyces sp. NPDC002920]
MTSRYQWRHADIAARTSNLAAGIREVCGTDRKVVALECERGLSSVIAMLAVLEADCLPLLGSSSAPIGRRIRLREAARAAVVLSGSVDGEFSLAVHETIGPAPWPEAAYLASTSGTTGLSKIAPISSVVFEAYVRDIQEAYGLTGRDRVLQFAPASFDVFMEEVIPTFRASATVVVPPWEHVPAVEAFLDFLDAEAVTVVNLPSSYWMGVANYLRDADRSLPPSVRLVVMGSEPVARSLVEWSRESLPDVKLLNAYGTSELAPTCFIFDCDELPKATAHPDIVPIGGPLPFMRYEIVRQQNRLLGQLHLRTDPSSDEVLMAPGHDTGDLASLEPDGYVYLHGRADLTRLKRGGVTVNAESLAAAARECDGVLGAVAKMEQVSSTLVLIVQSAQASEEIAERVGAHLRAVLPLSWLPDRVQVTSGMEHPLGTKMSTLGPVSDEPDLTSAVRDAWTRWTPATDVEEHTDFFDVGGNSIGAVRMCGQVSDSVLHKVPVQLIFASPRFGDFVRAVEALLKRS